MRTGPHETECFRAGDCVGCLRVYTRRNPTRSSAPARTGATTISGRLHRPNRRASRSTAQDAQHPGPTPSYKDNGDGTISDLNTGLMWVQARGPMLAWDAARAGAGNCRVGGYSDWRMPTIKELYSLINFNGGFHLRAADSTPYLDTKYFGFTYGDESHGERGIDCQDWSATEYVGTTMGGNPTVFGVNFADGRIKGYPKVFPGGRMVQKYVRYVRGNPSYGQNDFHDNGDGTIIDRATGLMWSKADSGKGMNWEDSLAWVQQCNARSNILATAIGVCPTPRNFRASWTMPVRLAKRDLLQYLRSFKSLSSATAIIRTSGPVQRTWTALLIGKAMLPSTSPSDVRWAGCNRMLAVGHLATASRDRKVQVWLGRVFVGRDKDLHQISTGSHRWFRQLSTSRRSWCRCPAQRSEGWRPARFPTRSRAAR